MEFTNATEEEVRQATKGKRGQYADLLAALEASPTKAVMITLNGQSQQTLTNCVHAKAREMGRKVSTRKMGDGKILIALLPK